MFDPVSVTVEAVQNTALDGGVRTGNVTSLAGPRDDDCGGQSLDEGKSRKPAKSGEALAPPGSE